MAKHGGISVVEPQPDAGTVEMCGRLLDTLEAFQAPLGEGVPVKIPGSRHGIRVGVLASPFVVICQWESRICGPCQDCKELGLNLLNSI